MHLGLARRLLVVFISCLLVIDVGYLFCFIGGGLLVCGWSVWGGLVGAWALLCVVVCLGVGFACACGLRSGCLLCGVLHMWLRL